MDCFFFIMAVRFFRYLKSKNRHRLYIFPFFKKSLGLFRIYSEKSLGFFRIYSEKSLGFFRNGVIYTELARGKNHEKNENRTP